MKTKMNTTDAAVIEAAIKQALQPILNELIDLRKEVARYREAMSDKCPIYSIGQVCKILGCSRSTFHKYWQLHHLPMPEPKITAGVRPTYSQADVEKLREALRR